MKQLIIIFLISLILVSCSNNEAIKYEYNGVTITRIDRDADVYFYYGNDINNLPKSYIKANYSGFNNGMGAYLVFENNKKVQLIRCVGLFKSIESDTNSKLQLVDHSSLNIFDFEKKIKNNYENVISLSNVIELEKEENIKNRSKVKATYPQ